MTKKTQPIESSGEPTKEYGITQAVLKDGFCNYSFKVLKGVGVNGIHAVKGGGIVLPDLEESFEMLNVHLAALDDVFKHSDVDVKNIDKMRNNELTALYRCTGFKIKGTEDLKKVILMGTKSVSVGGQISLETPEVLVEKLSSYESWKELKKVLDAAILEVELYNEGKYTEVHSEDYVDAAQTSMIDEAEFNEGKK